MSMSLMAFIIVYSAVFGVGYIYMMQLIKKGPQTGEGQYLQEGARGSCAHQPCHFQLAIVLRTAIMIDLPLIWFGIIIFSILMYIVMDGFDLGIGIIFPFNRNAEERDVMVNSVAPVWDGNETWLVMGGASLYGAFPLAYAVITDALAAPLTLMLIGLIFRGVAFEFRFKATPAHKPFWDKAFISGSILAAFCQGIVVGAVINGLPVSGRAYAGSAFIWLDPFALFCGLGLLIAYALLGSTWLMVKTEGHLQHKMAKLTLPLLLALMVAMGIISLWTPLAHPHIANRWFSLPNLFWFLPVPVLVLFSSWGSSGLLTAARTTPPFS